MLTDDKLVVTCVEDWGDEIVGVKVGETYPLVRKSQIGKEAMFVIKWRGEILPFPASLFTEPMTERLAEQNLYGRF